MVKTHFWKLVTALAIVIPLALPAQQNEDVLRPHGGKKSALNQVDTNSPSFKKGKIYVGVEGGINYNMYSASVSGLESLDEFKSLMESGSGVAPYFNVFVDYPLNKSLGIQLNVGYEGKSFEQSNVISTSCDNVNLFTGAIDSSSLAKIDVSLMNKISFLAIGAKVRYNLLPDLMLTVGPTIQLAMSGATQKLKATVISPDNCFFNFNTPEQSKTIETADVEIPAGFIQSTRVGIDLGFGYIIPVNKSVSIVPRVGYQYFFSPIFVDRTEPNAINNQTQIYTKQNLNSIQAGIAVVFGIDW